MAVTAVLSLLALLALQAAAQQVKYFEISKDLKLDPNYPQAITSITWKHKGNIVAEYIEGVVELEYLGDFKGRAKMNKTTGILTVRNMTKSDDGLFTVEINNIVLPVQFKAVGIKSLKEYNVEVIERPLTCSSDAENCFLDCGNEFKDAEPVTYYWKEGETGDWQEGDKRLVISKETEQVTTFTCRAENLFSNVTSAPHRNPYNEKHGGGPPLAAVLAPSLILVAVAVGICVWLIKTRPPWLQKLLNGNSGPPTENRKELEGLNPNNPGSGHLDKTADS